MNNCTSELIKSFSELSINDKRKELGRELSESVIIISKLLSDITGVGSLPNLDDFNNLYDGKLSESEYLTGLYEDFINYKELLSIYLKKVLEDTYQ